MLPSPSLSFLNQTLNCPKANDNGTMNNLIKILRMITGLVFMLSGFVKGVDPLGTAYRFEDYFIVYHLTWLMPLAL